MFFNATCIADCIFGAIKDSTGGWKMGMRGLLTGMAVLLFATTSAVAVVGGGEIVFPAVGVTSVLFSHEFHVNKAKKRCSECHYGLYTNRAQNKTVGMANMQKGKSCGACHDGAKAFSVKDNKHCVTCHSVQSPAK
jgi:c(7)-type cytochrome triheme protein